MDMGSICRRTSHHSTKLCAVRMLFERIYFNHKLMVFSLYNMTSGATSSFIWHIRFMETLEWYVCRLVN